MRQLKVFFKFLLGLYYFFKFKITDRKKIEKASIVMFLPFYHTGGAEKVHLDILRSLKEEKCCVIFTHLSATKNFYDDFKKHAQIIELNTIRNKRSDIIKIALEKTIIKYINKSKTIHSIFGCNTKYFYQLLPKISDKLNRIDLIHALSENDNREKILAESSQLITTRISINNKAKNDLIKIYRRNNIDAKFDDRLVIIQNGVDVTMASTKNISEKTKFIFGFIGRWSEEKRPKLFLEIAKEINEKYPNVDFVMAGTGMKSNLNLINESGVSFLGEITNKEDLNDLYKSLTGIIIPSVYEGFPMVMMESMIFGVIPLSTNVGGISDHISHFNNGILINSKNEIEIIRNFVDQITFLIENKLESQRLANSAKEYAVFNFGIKKFNASYQKIFKIGK